MLATFVKKIGILSLIASLLMVVAVAPTLSAIDITEGSQDESNKVLADNQDNDDFATIVGNVIALFLFVLGIAAVFMIIFGGFRYVTSNGDSGKLEGAKNTILYSVVGLVVAIFAYALVNFTLGLF